MELNVINDQGKPTAKLAASDAAFGRERSEEHTSELQSQ